MLQIQKVELGDDKSLSPSNARDLELKLQKDGENAFAFDFGEIVVAVHSKRSYSQQYTDLEQSSEFGVKKAIDTDQNQLSIGLTS